MDTSKRLFLLMSALAIFVAAKAQKDSSYWTTEGNLGLNISQTGYKNWSAGGENSIAIIGKAFFLAKRQKGNKSWDNQFMADLGFLNQGNDGPKKTDDRVEFNSKYGIKASKYWNYTVLYNFKTQFLSGYDYSPDTPVYISNFMAPAYTKISIGMDYKPNSNLSVYISPITAKWTFVKDQYLADLGAFGLTPAEHDTNGLVIAHASRRRTEIGAFVRVAYAAEIAKNITLQAKAELFSNYLYEPQNIDVDVEANLIFKVNDYFNASFSAHYIYDNDILIGVDANGNGSIDYYGPRSQFKEVIGLGIMYKF